MFAGFLFGLAACFLWGFVYLVPLVLPEYDPILISAGRYACFGIVALPLIWIERHEFAKYTLADWIYVAKLGVIGNIVYYWMLSVCIQLSGAPLAGMCMALVPVTVSIIANMRSRKTGGKEAVPWMRLAPSLFLIGLGLVIGNWQDLEKIIRSSLLAGMQFWIGLAFGIGALALWTWYPIRNRDWLIENPKRTARAWSTAQGLTTLPFAIVLYIVTWQVQTPGGAFFGPNPVWFLTVVTVSGIVCSWIGILFWNAMSQRLPAVLSGQMIVFETIFAIVFAHMYNGVWPTWTMVVGVVLLIAGVLSALKVFR